MKKIVFLDFALLLLRWGVLCATVMERAGPLLNAVPALGGKLGRPSSLGSAKPIPAKSQMKCLAVSKPFIVGSLQEPVPAASGTAHPGASLATFSSTGMEPNFASWGDRR